MAQERHCAEGGQRVGHELGERGEGVFEDQRGDFGGVFAREVDGDGAADRLPVQDLRREPGKINSIADCHVLWATGRGMGARG